MIDTLVQFGVAGLMGALWIWERAHSRQREQQLSAAHEQLVQRNSHLRVLTALVHDNTRALVEFERTQRRLVGVLEGIRHAIDSHHADR